MISGTSLGRGRVAALGFSALLVFGCGSDEESSGDPGGEVRYPSASLDLFDRDADRFLAGALSVLTQRCMNDAGFDYATTDPVELAAADDAAPSSLYPFQGIDVEIRRAEGYRGWAAADDVPEPTISAESTQQAFFEALSPSEQARYEVTLAGEPDEEGEIPLFGGCYGVSARQVFDDPERWADLNQSVRNIEAEVNVRMMSNRELLDLELEWARCMHDAGFNINSTSDAVSNGMQLYQGQTDLSPSELEPLRRQEIALAVADATCSEDVGLGAAAARVHDEVVEEVLAEREGEILAFQEQLGAAVERARGLVGTP